MKAKPSLVFWDIETSLIKASVFSLKQEYIQPENITQDWYIICASWSGVNGKIHSVSVLDDKKRFKKNPYDDYYVVETLREVIINSDLLIHHNGDKFDLKKFNTRLSYHNLEPLPPVRTLDTLKEVKKFGSFTSNKLDYLGDFYNIGRKIHTDGKLWLDIQNKGIDAVKEIKKMVKYNKQDVNLLRGVFMRFKKYIRGFPQLSDERVCPQCSSYSLQFRGYQRNKTSEFHRYQCNDCGSWSRERLSDRIFAKVVSI